MQARDAGRFGLTLPAPVVDWPSIRDRVFGRIDPISEAGLAWRLSDPSVTLFRGTARFTGVRTLAVTLAETGDEVGFTADQVVLAAGSRPYHAPIEGFVVRRSVTFDRRLPGSSGESEVAGQLVESCGPM